MAHPQSSSSEALITYCMSISYPLSELLSPISGGFPLKCSIFTFAFLWGNERNEYHCLKLRHFVFLSLSFASFSFLSILLGFLSCPDEVTVSCSRNINHSRLIFFYDHYLNIPSLFFELGLSQSKFHYPLPFWFLYSSYTSALILIHSLAKLDIWYW